MRPQYVLRTIILSGLLAGAAPWLVIDASAQGYTLPESTPTETFPDAGKAAEPWRWHEDCTPYRDQRDKVQMSLGSAEMEQRQIDWIIQERDPGYRNSRLQDVKSHFDMMVRGAEFAFDRSFLSGQTHEAANKTRASKIAEIQKERQDQIDRIETDYSKDKARQESRRASLPKEISALNQQLGAANQAVNDCQKRLSESRKEPQMDEVLITQLLTALINQTQLEEWERGLPEERKAAAEKKKARERIRRSEEKTRRQTGRTEKETEQMHDPTASAVGSAILEGVISGAVSGAISRSRSSGGGSTSSGGGSHAPTKGGCSGGVCR